MRRLTLPEGRIGVHPVGQQRVESPRRDIPASDQAVTRRGEGDPGIGTEVDILAILRGRSYQRAPALPSIFGFERGLLGPDGPTAFSSMK